MAEEWIPVAEARGLVVSGSLSDKYSTDKRTNGHGSIEQIGRWRFSDGVIDERNCVYNFGNIYIS